MKKKHQSVFSNFSVPYIGNALFCEGRKFDSPLTFQQLGNISIDYGCNYQPNGPNSRKFILVCLCLNGKGAV